MPGQGSGQPVGQSWPAHLRPSDTHSWEGDGRRWGKGKRKKGRGGREWEGVGGEYRSE